MTGDITEKLDIWGIVELMGHNRISGRVVEQTIAGSAFLRVDVPAVNGQPAYSRLLNPAAIYAINPCSQDIAERAAREGYIPKPVAYEFRPPPALKPAKPDCPDPNNPNCDCAACAEVKRDQEYLDPATLAKCIRCENITEDKCISCGKSVCLECDEAHGDSEHPSSNR